MQQTIKKTYKINVDIFLLNELIQEGNGEVDILDIVQLDSLFGEVFIDGRVAYFTNRKDYTKYLLKNGPGARNDKEN